MKCVGRAFVVLFVVLIAGCSSAQRAKPDGRATSFHLRPSESFRALLAGSRQVLTCSKQPVSLLLTMRVSAPTNRLAETRRIYDPTSRHASPFQRVRPESAGFSTPRVVRTRAFLAAHGLRTQWSAGNPWMIAIGSPRRVRNVFDVPVHCYQAPSGIHFWAAPHAARVPHALTSWIAGAGRISTYPAVRESSVPAGGLSPVDVVKAYDATPLRKLGIDGAGQTVVLPEIDGVDFPAIRAYAKLYHLPPFRISMHGSSPSAGAEATMDVEVIHAIAPRAHLVIYNFNPSVSNAQWIAQTSHMLTSQPGAIVSESVGGCEQGFSRSDARVYESVVARADLTGTAMFASSGDNGAYDCIGHGEAPSGSFLGVDLPAGLPAVTGVGGTRISVRKNGGWFDEAAWQDSIETAGGGGGFSRYFARPSWQRGDGIPTSGATRIVPDVSADADPDSGMSIEFGEGRGQGGGTSQATPIWAGITALIDGYLEKHGHHRVGWMNPALYYLASTAQTYPPFHDITLGTNLHYAAGPGYDPASGIGSPDAWNLARDLVAYQTRRHR